MKLWSYTVGVHKKGSIVHNVLHFGTKIQDTVTLQNSALRKWKFRTKKSKFCSKNWNSTLRKCKLCTLKLQWYSKQTAQKCAPKWKFYAQKMEILSSETGILMLPPPGKVVFCTIFCVKSGNSVPFHAAMCKSKFCAKFHNCRIADSWSDWI